MKWTLNYDGALSIVALVFTGRNTGQDLRESTSEAIALGKRQGCLKFLVDATDMELDATRFELYDLPATQYRVENLDRRSRAALVLPKLPKELEDAKFYETACVNRGWRVKSFRTRDEAIEWLKGIDPSEAPTHATAD